MKKKKMMMMMTPSSTCQPTTRPTLSCLFFSYLPLGGGLATRGVRGSRPSKRAICMSVMYTISQIPPSHTHTLLLPPMSILLIGPQIFLHYPHSFTHSFAPVPWARYSAFFWHMQFLVPTRRSRYGWDTPSHSHTLQPISIITNSGRMAAD
ncbi:hypothetical protein ASPTUDRAFT_600666 [Aspergillus tubingensis CBS 134.48]|uniref:Uncharacterized protein n=1 Tax=Aspergillus tubingensis (strain CBS 134.48) TaxID=767770 RepID=A0A1L9N9M5_ASPTC|nr:hypothetical protein ASPTUDRAFT_600666 [Aspergillus tubingensis CBS 134.48]